MDAKLAELDKNKESLESGEESTYGSEVNDEYINLIEEEMETGKEQSFFRLFKDLKCMKASNDRVNNAEV